VDKGIKIGAWVRGWRTTSIDKLDEESAWRRKLSTGARKVEGIKELLGLLTALIALVPVAIQYSATRSGRPGAPSGTPLGAKKVVKEHRASQPRLTTEARPTQRVLIGFVLWLFQFGFYGGLAFLIFLVILQNGEFPYFLRGGLVAYALLLMLFCLWAEMGVLPHISAMYTLLSARFKGPPWARRQGEVIVAGTDIQAVQGQCVTALRKTGATLAEIDSANGVIKAVKASGRWYTRFSRLVDYITICITPQKDSIQILITSDGVRPALGAPDGRRHTSNVNQIVDYLVG
jgi:hypothetical protein